ncbi:hypothetical protein SPHINGO8AM_120076 [Sphingomonas sp. 8AM]|nr:hypothetical protein SPHINGO8AM_120076 [Sphingomonas sp. 8AM]
MQSFPGRQCLLESQQPPRTSAIDNRVPESGQTGFHHNGTFSVGKADAGGLLVGRVRLRPSFVESPYWKADASALRRGSAMGMAQVACKGFPKSKRVRLVSESWPRLTTLGTAWVDINPSVAVADKYMSLLAFSRCFLSLRNAGVTGSSPVSGTTSDNHHPGISTFHDCGPDRIAPVSFRCRGPGTGRTSAAMMLLSAVATVGDSPIALVPV